MYKMLKPPKERKVTYLRVVSPPVGYGGKSIKASIPELKVGSITWTYSFNSQVIILEENQFSVNFDSRCFEEIQIEYRFKTKEEFLAEGRWNFDERAPSEWNRNMNKYLGAPVPYEYYKHCNESSNFIYEGWYFSKNDYTIKPLEVTILETKEESLYRFKTEEEFKKDGLWDYVNGAPKRWNSSGRMNHYLGKPVDRAYNMNCDNKEFIEIFDASRSYTWSFSPQDYVLISDSPLRESSIGLKSHEIEDTVVSALDVPEHSDSLPTNKEVLDENPFKKVDEFIQREKDEKQKTSVENDFTQMININI